MAKLRYCEKATKFEIIFPIVLTRERLFQILWPSHNILTLPLIIHWNCFWIISLFTNTILWNLDFDMASNGRCVFEGGKLPPSSLGRVCLCNWLWGNPVFGRFSMACVSRFVLLVLIGGNKGLSIIGLPGSDSSTMQKNKYAY